MSSLMDLMTTLAMHNIFDPEPLGQYMTREYYRPKTPILSNPSGIASDVVFMSVYMIQAYPIYDHPIFTICGCKTANAIIQLDMKSVYYELDNKSTQTTQATQSMTRYALPVATTSSINKYKIPKLSTGFEDIKKRVVITGQWAHTEDMLVIDGGSWSKHVFDYSKYKYIGQFLKYWEIRRNRAEECFRNAAQIGTFNDIPVTIYHSDFLFNMDESANWNSGVNIASMHSNLVQSTFPIVYGICEILYDAPLDTLYELQKITVYPMTRKTVIDKLVLKNSSLINTMDYVSSDPSHNWVAYTDKTLADVNGYTSGKHMGWEPLNTFLGGLDSQFIRQTINTSMEARPIRNIEYGQDINGTLPLFANCDKVETVDIASDDASTNCFINLGLSTNASWLNDLINHCIELVIGKCYITNPFLDREINITDTFSTFSLSLSLEVSKLFAWFYHKTGQQLLRDTTTRYSEHFSRDKLYQMLPIADNYAYNIKPKTQFFYGEKLVFLKNNYDLEITVIPKLLQVIGDNSFGVNSKIDNISLSQSLINLPFSQYYSTMGCYNLKGSVGGKAIEGDIELFCKKIKLTPKSNGNAIVKLLDKNVTFASTEPEKITRTNTSLDLASAYTTEKYAFTPQICLYGGIVAFYTGWYIYVYYYNISVPYYEVYAVIKTNDQNIPHQIITNWEKTFIALWSDKGRHLRLLWSGAPPPVVPPQP